MDRLINSVHYEVIRRKGMKRINCRIISSELIRLTIPYGFDTKRVSTFIEDHRSWIEKSIQGFSTMPKMPPEHTYTTGDTFFYLDQEIVLQVQRGQTNCTFDEKKGILYVRSKREGVSQVKKTIENWYMQQGKQVYQNLVYQWLTQLAIERSLWPTAIDIAPFPSRLGSCSTDRSLRFALRSLMLPLSLIDYIALHEVVHLVYFDHGRDFKHMIQIGMPDWKERQSQLAWYRQRIHRL